MSCKEECMEQKKDGTLKDCPIVKENEELKSQIEKMKCCGNCKNCEINFTNDHGIKHGCKKLGRKCDDCILNNYYHWELKE
ncbi:MAG: hypothetical protein MJZ03_04430 [archaeon]|nr:hypothetical protein [archaeon]